uniref:Uncharacterized protein n=1 Tax=Picocystis salinarum TaxID=88271 RepID=A0A7S3UDJ1_9CHLO
MKERSKGWTGKVRRVGCFTTLLVGVVVLFMVHEGLYLKLSKQQEVSRRTPYAKKSSWILFPTQNDCSTSIPSSPVAMRSKTLSQDDFFRDMKSTAKLRQWGDLSHPKTTIGPDPSDRAATINDKAPVAIQFTEVNRHASNFSAFPNETINEFRMLPFTRPHCSQVLGYIRMSSWNDAVQRCQGDWRCKIVTMQRRTGDTVFCEQGIWQGLSLEWDAAVSETFLGVIPQKRKGKAIGGLPLPWPATCERCKEGMLVTRTHKGCMCSECPRGCCPSLDLLLPTTSSKPYLLPSTNTFTLFEMKRLNFSYQPMFFNPSVVEMGGVGVVAYRISDDSKCKGQSVLGNFISDETPLTGPSPRFSSKVLVCKFRSLLLQQKPIRCKVAHIRFSDIGNSRGLKPLKEGGSGIEDPRMFVAHGKLYMLANMGVIGAVEGRRMILVHLDWELHVQDAIFLWRSWNTSDAPPIEKNWGPLVAEGEIYMVYTICPFVLCKVSLVSGDCHLSIARPCPSELLPSSAIHFKGSTQWKKFPGGYLGVVHSSFQGVYGRIYAHRFITLSPYPFFQPVTVSAAFSLPAPSLTINNTFQYVSGLEIANGKIVLLYGVADCQSAALEIQFSSVYENWLVQPRKELATVWWHAACSKNSSIFCAGQAQYSQLVASLKREAVVQKYYPVLSPHHTSLKGVPEDYLLAGQVHSYGPSDVIVLHGRYHSLPVAVKKVVVAFSWPFHAIPQYMIQMAHGATEVWVESTEEAAIMTTKGIIKEKIRHIPLTLLDMPTCYDVDDTLAFSFLQRQYPVLSNDWDLLLLYVGGTSTIDGLAPMLSGYCTTFTGLDRILLVLLLPFQRVSELRTCQRYASALKNEQTNSTPPATLLVPEALWKSHLRIWIKHVDILVFPTLLFSYNSVLRQTIACGKPLITLWSQAASSYLSTSTVHYVSSNPLRIRYASLVSAVWSVLVCLTSAF